MRPLVHKLPFGSRKIRSLVIYIEVRAVALHVAEWSQARLGKYPQHQPHIGLGQQMHVLEAVVYAAPQRGSRHHYQVGSRIGVGQQRLHSGRSAGRGHAYGHPAVAQPGDQLRRARRHTPLIIEQRAVKICYI